MDFVSYLKRSQQEVEVELQKFYSVWREEAQRVNPKLLPLVDISIKASEGGKRLRAALVKLGYELAGGQERGIVKAAAAYEIFQTAILAHDDIIDRSPLRRGRPTIYQSLGGDHYAISQTICLGDIGLYQATQAISQSNFPDHLKIKAVNSFIKTVIETAIGEILDIEVPHSGQNISEDNALEISHLKTARYTFVGPLTLGAILAGADDDLLKLLESLGDNLGMAFQIQDDILGIFGTEESLGKSVSSDIEEGKVTILVAEALKKASLKQQQILKKFYGNGKISISDLDKVKKVIVETGALDYSLEVSLKYTDSAKEQINQLPESQFKEVLLQMADYLVNRKN